MTKVDLAKRIKSPKIILIVFKVLFGQSSLLYKKGEGSGSVEEL